MSNNVSEFRLRNVRFVLVAKSAPLFDLVFILIEFWCEREGDASRWQLRAALFEGRSHSFSQRFPIKFKSDGKAVQIVEVLHAAVGDAQLYHGFELFRDYGFARVGQQTRVGDQPEFLYHGE